MNLNSAIENLNISNLSLKQNQLSTQPSQEQSFELSRKIENNLIILQRQPFTQLDQNSNNSILQKNLNNIHNNSMNNTSQYNSKSPKDHQQQYTTNQSNHQQSSNYNHVRSKSSINTHSNINHINNNQELLKQLNLSQLQQQQQNHFYNMNNQQRQLSRENSQGSKVRLSDIIRNERKQLQETSSFKQLLLDQQINSIVSQNNHSHCNSNRQLNQRQNENNNNNNRDVGMLSVQSLKAINICNVNNNNQNTENIHTTLDLVQPSYDNRDNLIYSPTEETIRNNMNNQTQNLTNQLKNLNNNKHQQINNHQVSINNQVSEQNQTNLSYYLNNNQTQDTQLHFQIQQQQKQQQQQYMNDQQYLSHIKNIRNDLDKSLTHINLPLLQTQNNTQTFEELQQKYGLITQTNITENKHNSNFDNTREFKNDLENRYFMQSKEFKQISQFNQSQVINQNEISLNIRKSEENFNNQQQKQVQAHSFPVTMRQIYNDDEIQTQDNSANHSKQQIMQQQLQQQVHNQNQNQNISYYNPVDQSSSIYEYTQDYGSKKPNYNDLINSNVASPIKHQNQYIVNSNNLNNKLTRVFQDTNKFNKQLDINQTNQSDKLQFNNTQQNEIYLIKELDFLKQQLKDLEELHQSKIVENAQDIQQKDKYINKLEKQIREMTRQHNEQIMEYKNQLNQKEDLISQYKQGVKNLIKIVNQNKHIIIEDIIEHVKIFDSLNTTNKKSENNQEKIFDLLKVILETLFEKAKNISKIQSNHHQISTQQQHKLSMNIQEYEQAYNEKRLSNTKHFNNHQDSQNLSNLSIDQENDSKLNTKRSFNNHQQQQNNINQTSHLNSHKQSVMSNNYNYREPQQVAIELNDCQRKLQDLEILIQANKYIQPISLGTSTSFSQIPTTINQTKQSFSVNKYQNDYQQVSKSKCQKQDDCDSTLSKQQVQYSQLTYPNFYSQFSQQHIEQHQRPKSQNNTIYKQITIKQNQKHFNNQINNNNNTRSKSRSRSNKRIQNNNSYNQSMQRQQQYLAMSRQGSQIKLYENDIMSCKENRNDRSNQIQNKHNSRVNSLSNSRSRSRSVSKSRRSVSPNNHSLKMQQQQLIYASNMKNSSAKRINQKSNHKQYHNKQQLIQQENLNLSNYKMHSQQIASQLLENAQQNQDYNVIKLYKRNLSKQTMR